MSAFSSRKIVIPKDIWNQDWKGAVANQGEEERRILQFQERATGLLRHIPTQAATPERVAWMSFWARSFAVSKATLAALEAGSELMLTVLNRMSVEAYLQLALITEPLSKDGRQDFMDRMRGYTAWCLWGEKDLLEKKIDPKNWKAAWDTKTARKILDDPDTRSLEESLHWAGHEAYRVAQDGQQAEVEAQTKERLRRIEELFADASLANWRDKLLGSRSGLPFFGLFDEGKEWKTMRTHLEERGMLFAYSQYMKGSMAIHGSSLSEFLLESTEGSWFPRIVTVGKDWRERAMSIAWPLEEVYATLLLTTPQVWKTERPAT